MRLPHLPRRLSRRAAILAAVLFPLAACAPTLDEIRSEPVRFTSRQAVPWDTMANCIAARSTDLRPASLQTYPRERLATVIWPEAAEFTVRADGDGSLVEFRRRKLVADLGGFEASAREIVERCKYEPPRP